MKAKIIRILKTDTNPERTCVVTDDGEMQLTLWCHNSYHAELLLGAIEAGVWDFDLEDL